MQGDAFHLRVPVALEGPFERIELSAPYPVAPAELGAGADRRRIGAKFTRIRLL